MHFFPWIWLVPNNYLLRGPSNSQFYPKFCCHGNGGQSGVNKNDTVKLADPKYHTIEPKITSLSYDGLKNCLIFPIGAIGIFHIFVKK